MIMPGRTEPGTRGPVTGSRLAKPSCSRYSPLVVHLDPLIPSASVTASGGSIVPCMVVQ